MKKLLLMKSILVKSRSVMSRSAMSILVMSRSVMSILVMSLSPMVAMGIVPPYSQTFDSSAAVSTLTYIDANGDGNTFKYYSILDQETGNSNGCISNAGQTNGVDDWAVLPGMTLEANTYYEFGADLRAWSNRWAETFEVYVSTTPTVDGFTGTGVQLQDAVSIKHTDMKHYTYGFRPTTSGTYYFAIRHNNTGDSFRFIIDNLSVVKAASAELPDAPTDLVVTPDYNGGKKATVEFTAPTTSVDGNELTELTEATIYIDDVAATTISNPIPGQPYTLQVNITTEGYRDFAVTVSNETGESPKARQTRWIGIPIPARVASCEAKEVSNGRVRMTWPAITTDKDGYPINPDLVAYYVVRVVGGEFVVVGGTYGTEYEFDALDEGVEQDMFYAGIYSRTSAGWAESAPGCEAMAIGYPYTLPYKESLAGGEATHMFSSALTAGNGGTWNIMDDELYDVTSQDNDGGYAGCRTDYKTGAAKLMLGKFSVNSNTDEIRFWYWPFVESGEDANTLDVWVTAMGESKVTLATIEQSGTVGQWKEAVVPIGEFAGKDVRIEFNVTCVSRVYTMIDNITIGSEGTGVVSIDATSLPTMQSYDLQGRPQPKPQKGIFIINGKKIVCGEKME